MAGTGEVVALAEAPVDLAELRLVAQALAAAALAAATAHLLSLSLAARAQVPATTRLALLALAARAQVARFAAAHATGVGAYGAAAAAVGLREESAAAVTAVIHRHLQTVLEAHGLDGEAVLCAGGWAATCLHTHVEGDLRRWGKEGDRKGNEGQRLVDVL